MAGDVEALGDGERACGFAVAVPAAYDVTEGVLGRALVDGLVLDWREGWGSMDRWLSEHCCEGAWVVKQRRKAMAHGNERGTYLPSHSLPCLAERAAGCGAPGVEADTVLPQSGEQLLLTSSTQRVVLSLVDCGFHPAVALADLYHLLYLRGGVV